MKCSYGYPQCDSDGTLETFLRKSDGVIRQSPQCLEHRGITNEYWMHVDSDHCAACGYWVGARRDTIPVEYSRRCAECGRAFLDVAACVADLRRVNEHRRRAEHARDRAACYARAVLWLRMRVRFLEKPLAMR